MNTETLMKSFREAIEEIEDEHDLQKSEDDDEIIDDDEMDDDDEDDEELLQKAKAKAKKKKKMMQDEDYTDDGIDDEDDEDDEDMDKATVMGIPSEGESTDAKVLQAGRGMKTIIYMRKAISNQAKTINRQERMVKSLRSDIKNLTEAMSSNLVLTKKIGELVINSTEMTKSVKEEVQEMGDQPVESPSVKNAVDRANSGKDAKGFKNPTDAVEKDELLEKSMKAVREHKLPPQVLPMFESRLNSLEAGGFNPEFNLFEGKLSGFDKLLEKTS